MPGEANALAASFHRAFYIVLTVGSLIAQLLTKHDLADVLGLALRSRRSTDEAVIEQSGRRQPSYQARQQRPSCPDQIAHEIAA
ncbi:MAG: hypothetical protein ABFD89_22835 [Bryobacteraceae bacterium]